MSSDSRTKFTRRRLLGGLGGLTVALTAPIWKPVSYTHLTLPTKA